MKKIIRKYYLSSFYFITLLLSFFLIILHFIFPSAGNYSVSFAQLSPAFAVIFIAFLFKNHSILKDIKNHFLLDKSFIKYVIPTIAIPSIAIVVSSFIMTYSKIDYVVWEGDLSFYMLNFVAIVVGCAAEEIGWRGFLLPNLQKQYSPFISSIIVGILWGVWHLNFTGGILGFFLYTVTIIEMSILMSWIYNKSNGNLFLMTIWHIVFNVTSHIFLWERFNLNLFIVESIVFGIMCIMLLVSLIRNMRPTSFEIVK